MTTPVFVLLVGQLLPAKTCTGWLRCASIEKRQTGNPWIEEQKATTMQILQRLKLAVGGMDCPECCGHVHEAIVTVDPSRVDMEMLCQAVKRAGYDAQPVRQQQVSGERGRAARHSAAKLARSLLTLYSLLFGAVLLLVIAGEWLACWNVSPISSPGTSAPV
ncbi:hypothetical protein [Thermogemmatispora tikiterensis]|uniref:HMA domain-containing protein n=1 Tax=Thermogemmatispora tikiterensis TaxID=1825093 RepID=A0A328VI78_9CHLR|nr:hypothetical protein [Thermogemmatispora tikiterensis]RAQ93995.1 hypothetical protein A4R35_00525 [Thermogemmatispora tikiterensis]